MTPAQAVTALLRHERPWEARSAGSDSKGEWWYAWAWLATASPRHHLLVRGHLKTGTWPSATAAGHDPDPIFERHWL